METFSISKSCSEPFDRIISRINVLIYQINGQKLTIVISTISPREVVEMDKSNEIHSLSVCVSQKLEQPFNGTVKICKTLVC